MSLFRVIRTGAKGALPLRLRLALLTTGLVGLALLVFGLLVYFTLARTLASEIDHALRDRAAVAIRQIVVHERPTGYLVEPPDVDAISSGGAVLQAVLLGGDVVRSESLKPLTLPISREAIAAAQSRRALFEDVEVAGRRLRLYNVPLVYRESVIGVLQVARPLDEMAQTLTRLRLVLIGGGAGVVVLGTIFSLLVARAALRPIDRLTREMERIGETQGFGERVAGRGAQASDEVGRLASAFNAMLDRLQLAYAALQNANTRLAAALDSQRRFVADASHELRTPLTTVRGNASLLRRFDVLTSQDREAAVEQIAAESERMSRLVSDLLTLARADAGQPLERLPVPVGPLVEAVAQQARLLTDGKVSISVLRSGRADVHGDADKLRQLLLILVDNAIKYTPPGGNVTISMRVDRLTGANQVVKLSVIDTGIGIDPKDLPHIFERFYRADRARRTGGTGLGLSIAKWIVEAHGGKIDVESSPGAGSIFTVTLPALPAAEPGVSPSDLETDHQPSSHERERQTSKVA